MKRVCEGAGEAEIGELDGAVGGDEQVVAFYVAVQDGVCVAEPDGSGEHAGPGFYVAGAVGDGLGFPESFEVAEGEVLEDERDVLVLCGEDGVEFYYVGVREFLEEFYFADGVHGYAVFVVGVYFYLFDGDEGGGGVPVVA